MQKQQQLQLQKQKAKNKNKNKNKTQKPYLLLPGYTKYFTMYFSQ